MHKVDHEEVRELTKLRRRLHTIAELSGEEEQTARLLGEALEDLAPDHLIGGLGGHGLAGVFGDGGAGPTVLLRADMDALPIEETPSLKHASRNPGVSHKCGHDGHMAIAVGVARRFSKERPAKGRLVVLFQPAEETGCGAAEVIRDPRFAEIRPDIAVAVHNLPGFELGEVILRKGPFACASRGLVCELTGASSHAAEPERGKSPALAVGHIITAWSSARQLLTGLSESAQATVIHAAVGRPAFGTSPGDGRVMATLRAPDDRLIDSLEQHLRRIAGRIADAWDVASEFRTEEVFPATNNDPEIVAVIGDAAASLGRTVTRPDHPFPWSEDFGHFAAVCPSALIGLGSGEDRPALHHPSFDFPDELIPGGIAFLETALRRWLGARR